MKGEICPQPIGGGLSPAPEGRDLCRMPKKNSQSSVRSGIFCAQLTLESGGGISTGKMSLSKEQRRIISEIKRVANELGVKSLSQNQFDQHHRLGGVSTAGYQFGSWNEAVTAAGLKPLPSGGSDREPRYSDNELLGEIIRLHKEFGKPPSERLLASKGKFSPKPYRDRWGRSRRRKRLRMRLTKEASANATR